MSVLRGLGRTASTTARAARGAGRGGVRASRFVGRNVLHARQRGAAGETGMMRLLDLHAASCAGDALVTLGLAGTVFFSVPTGEARGRVALYLLVTMLPFALLAPVVGPVLDRFRHGRRYALAVTMIGRAFLAYMISDHLTGFTLYPAAFGMLVLSRAYGVARSAAVPRLLPAGLGLSEAGARASVFGTFAGAIVLPFGLIGAQINSQVPLWLAMIPFLYGTVVSLRLPPRADSDPPEQVPRPLQAPGHKGAKVLSGRLVIAALIGSATLRGLYGFLTLYLAFAVKGHDLPLSIFGFHLSDQLAIVVVGAGLGVGSFVATAVGTRLRIHRPALLQGGGIVLAALVAVLAAIRGTLLTVALLCLVTAVASGLAKLSVDATIQERIPERVRASAFAHSETLLMIAWVAGGAIGLIPFTGRWGLLVMAAAICLGAVRAVLAAGALRNEKLKGAPAEEERAPVDPDATTVAQPSSGSTSSSGSNSSRTDSSPRTGSSNSAGSAPSTGSPSGAGSASGAGSYSGSPSGAGSSSGGGSSARADEPMPRWEDRRGAPAEATTQPVSGSGEKRSRFAWRKRVDVPARADTAPTTTVEDAPTRRLTDEEDERLAPPGYTLYRPSGLDETKRFPDER